MDEEEAKDYAEDYGAFYQKVSALSNNGLEVENTFKINGTNYREEIGEVNGNEDYKPSDLNIYDLFIPYSALKTKKAKGIILFIHGGAWVACDRTETAFLAQIYFEHEYITANMEYTLLNETKKDTNLYRILDEISACIENIKSRLINIGFNESELQMAVGGLSAGAHLSILYSYLMKNHPLPIKFIIDIVGPINVDTENYYIIEKEEDTLPDIEPETVDKAMQENEYNKSKRYCEDSSLVMYLNLFIGGKYSKEEIMKTKR